MTEKRYYYVRRVAKEAFNYDREVHEGVSDWPVILAAIPFLGTGIILLYFVCRRREVQFEKVKR